MLQGGPIDRATSETRILLLRPPGVAALITIAAILTIATVWAFEISGYTPCELCLTERIPFYVSIPCGLLAVAAAWAGHRRATRILFVLLALTFVLSAGLAAYHTGVEWGFWPGPTGCSGAIQAAASVGDFLKQLDTVKVVRCDQAALRVLGLSLAGWNVAVSLLLVFGAALGFRRAGLAS